MASWRGKGEEWNLRLFGLTNSHCWLPYHLVRPAIKERESKREKETLSPSPLSFFLLCLFSDRNEGLLWRFSLATPLRPSEASAAQFGDWSNRASKWCQGFSFSPYFEALIVRGWMVFCVCLIFSCHQKALIFLEMQFPSSTTFEGLAFRGARPCQFCVHFLRPANCAKPTKKSVLCSPYYYNKNKLCSMTCGRVPAKGTIENTSLLTKRILLYDFKMKRDPSGVKKVF